MTDDQQAVVIFLKNPFSYGDGVERVETIETHASLVFLAGDRAYKLKRAVKYPYLDFSTAALRREACETELALNRRTAPALYLEVRRLVRTAAGGIGFSLDGSVLGVSFTVPSLMAVSGLHEAEVSKLLDALVARELLTLDIDPRSPERGQYRFLQGVVREVAYQSMGKRSRQAKHLAVRRDAARRHTRKARAGRFRAGGREVGGGGKEGARPRPRRPGWQTESDAERSRDCCHPKS